MMAQVYFLSVFFSIYSFISYDFLLNIEYVIWKAYTDELECPNYNKRAIRHLENAFNNWWHWFSKTFHAARRNLRVGLVSDGLRPSLWSIV